jgi:hypothetical protein
VIRQWATINARFKQATTRKITTVIQTKISKGEHMAKQLGGNSNPLAIWTHMRFRPMRDEGESGRALDGGEVW